MRSRLIHRCVTRLAQVGPILAVETVMAVSLTAMLALIAAFFAVLGFVPASTVAQRALRAIVAGVAGASAWFAATALGRRLGWVESEEAAFHHLYVLGVVGLPLAGLTLLAISARWPTNDRRLLRMGRALAAVFVLPGLLGVWGTHVEPRWLRVDRVTIAATDTPIRIGVIADIQTDQVGDWEHHVVDRLVAEAPDLIVVAGDLTQLPNHRYNQIRPAIVDLLAALEAPGGVWVIAGNTDPSSEEVVAVAAAAGHRALIDEVAEIEIRGRIVRLGGLAWPNTDRQNARRFIDDFGRSSTDDTVDVLLTHSPDPITSLGSESAIDLVVAGHTHGGQIAVPMIGPLWNVTDLPDTIAAGGLHDMAGTPLYVSPGVGVQRGESPRVRIGVRPSVAVLTF